MASPVPSTRWRSWFQQGAYEAKITDVTGRPVSFIVMHIQLSGNLALELIIRMSERVFQSWHRCTRKRSEHSKGGHLLQQKTTLQIYDLFLQCPSTNRTTLKVHKIYASSFIVVSACGSHLFVFLTWIAHSQFTQYTDGKYYWEHWLQLSFS